VKISKFSAETADYDSAKKCTIYQDQYVEKEVRRG
jgi:hypothetical protein